MSKKGHFTLNSKEEVLQLEANHSIPELKKIFAEEITSRIHSENEFKAVLSVSELLFGRSIKSDNIRSLSSSVWEMVSKEIPSFSISKELISTTLDEFLTEHVSIFNSKGDFRRSIKGNALAINKVKINDPNHSMNSEYILEGGYILIENGKKNKFLIHITGD